MIQFLFGAPRITIDSNTHVIIDGNSIYSNIGGEPMDIALSRTPPFLDSGCSYSNLAVSGQTWTQMRASGSDVDGAYVDGKLNILIAGETTNEAWLTNKTEQEIWDVASGYFDDRRTAHPDLKTVICGSLPFWGAPNNNTARNQTMLGFDQLMRDNWRSFVDGKVDYHRTDLPWFNHDGSLITYFEAYEELWADQYLHPNTDGKMTMAEAIANVVKRMPI